MKNNEHEKLETKIEKKNDHRKITPKIHHTSSHFHRTHGSMIYSKKKTGKSSFEIEFHHTFIAL